MNNENVHNSNLKLEQELDELKHIVGKMQVEITKLRLDVKQAYKSTSIKIEDLAFRFKERERLTISKIVQINYSWKERDHYMLDPDLTAGTKSKPIYLSSGYRDK